MLRYCFLFLWHTVNKVDQKVQSFSHKDSHLEALVTCLLTLNSFLAWC